MTRCYWWLREAAALPYDAVLAVVLRLRQRRPAIAASPPKRPVD